MDGIHHVDLVVTSLERSLPFYKGLLEPLGWTRETPIEGERGERIVYLGRPGGASAIGLREAQSDGAFDRYATGLHHLCLAAASREQVDERFAWARDNGATIESEPREYDYMPGYYAVFLHDPDGIKLEIVTND
jgi:catechol 2,3-dioxygenase-like lactoylglutathione lyase family enzyme